LGEIKSISLTPEDSDETAMEDKYKIVVKKVSNGEYDELEIEVYITFLNNELSAMGAMNKYGYSPKLLGCVVVRDENNDQSNEKGEYYLDMEEKDGYTLKQKQM
jgi:hypothetical protein